MHLLVGLGNPGSSYAKTRHNVGFMVVDLLCAQLGLSWKHMPQTQAMIAEGRWEEEKVVLIKPMTFMNASGLAVQATRAKYGITPENIIVISDDVALPVGEIRVRTEGGSGGHNGLKSLVATIGSDTFVRIRLGVGSPPPLFPLEDWVLGRLPPQEHELFVTKIIPESINIIAYGLHQGFSPSTKTCM